MALMRDRTERLIVVLTVAAYAIGIAALFSLAATAEAQEGGGGNSTALDGNLTITLYPQPAPAEPTYSQQGLWLPVFVTHPDFDYPVQGWPFVILSSINNLADPEQLRTAQLWANSLASVHIWHHEEQALKRIRNSLPVSGGAAWLVDTVHEPGRSHSFGPDEIELVFEGIHEPWLGFPPHMLVHDDGFVVKAAHHTVGGTAGPAIFNITLWNATEALHCPSPEFIQHENGTWIQLPAAPCERTGHYYPDAVLEHVIIPTGQAHRFALPSHGIYYWGPNASEHGPGPYRVDWFQ